MRMIWKAYLVFLFGVLLFPSSAFCGPNDPPALPTRSGHELEIVRRLQSEFGKEKVWLAPTENKINELNDTGCLISLMTQGDSICLQE